LRLAQSLQLAASQQPRNMAALGGNVVQRTRCPYFRDTRESFSVACHYPGSNGSQRRPKLSVYFAQSRAARFPVRRFPYTFFPQSILMSELWLTESYDGGNMGPYYFSLTNGQRVLGGREPTELADLAQVQAETIAFGRSIVKHRHTIGIDDLSAWSVRVTNEVGRVLALVPLSRLKQKPADCRSLPAHDHVAANASRSRFASSALR
jgi:hypothetical protein